MLLIGCESSRINIDSDRCLTDSVITFKENQNFDELKTKTTKDNLKANMNYCCSCIEQDPICQKPKTIQYCKERNGIKRFKSL